jgi:hypothetical protein
METIVPQNLTTDGLEQSAYNVTATAITKPEAKAAENFNISANHSVVRLDDNQSAYAPSALGTKPSFSTLQQKRVSKKTSSNAEQTLH